MAGKPDALDRYLATRFPSVNPTLPTIIADGTIVPAGKVSIPAEGELPTQKGGPASSVSSSQPPATGASGDKGTAPSAPLDWRAYLEDWGFPTDVVNELDRIFRTYSDSNAAGAAGLAYIRGTDWYKTTFPGIQAGLKNGLVSNEAGYRSYVNDLNQVYQRYFGRNVSGDETAGFLNAGKNPNQVGAHLQGQAYVTANKPEFQYELGAFGEGGQASDSELNALGDQQAGLDNPLGPLIQKRLALAQQRLQASFQGVLASPSLNVLNNGRLAAPSLGGGINPSDVGA